MFGCLKTLYKSSKLSLVHLFKYIFTKKFFFRWKQKVHTYKTLTNCPIETTQQTFHPRPTKKYTSNKRISTTKTYQNDMTTITALGQPPILVYPKLVTSDRFSLCGEKNNKMTKTDKSLFGKNQIVLCKIALL